VTKLSVVIKVVRNFVREYKVLWPVTVAFRSNVVDEVGIVKNPSLIHVADVRCGPSLLKVAVASCVTKHDAIGVERRDFAQFLKYLIGSLTRRRVHSNCCWLFQESAEILTNTGDRRQRQREERQSGNLLNHFVAR
jgi:hypothetical protein